MQLQNYGTEIENYIRRIQYLYNNGEYEGYEDKILNKLTKQNKQILEEVYLKKNQINVIAKELNINEAACRKRAEVLRKKIIKELSGGQNN